MAILFVSKKTRRINISFENYVSRSLPARSQWEVIGIWRDESEIGGRSKYAVSRADKNQYFQWQQILTDKYS